MYYFALILIFGCIQNSHAQGFNGEWDAGMTITPCRIHEGACQSEKSQTCVECVGDCVFECNIGETQVVDQNCLDFQCPTTDGMWGQWVEGECVGECDTGVQTFSRACDDPEPSADGAPCAADDVTGHTDEYTASCTLDPCTADWTTWADSSACSTSCGSGIVDQERFCSGTGCSSGFEERTFVCEQDPCPEPTWTEWDNSGSCSVTCGDGVVDQERFCNIGCNDFEERTFLCNLGECPGEWSAWIEGDCSVSCGPGTKISTRSCEGSSFCIEEPVTGYTDSKEESCEDAVCTSWSMWVTSECNPTCGESASAVKERHCTPDGESCLLEGGGYSDMDTETITCEVPLCIINGVWSNWDLDECSVSCGGGTRTKTRTCNDPEPANMGTDCDGLPSEEETCNTQSCSVDGGWTGWSEWSDCSVTCNAGIETRDRSCTDPEPSNGGMPCTGSDVDYRPCLNTLCEIDAEWSEWADWSDCSQTCGDGGVRTSHRECLNPPNCEQDFETATQSCGDDDTCRLSECPDEPGPCDCNFEYDCGWFIESSTNAWRIMSGPTTSTKTGPSGDHTFPNGCGNYAYYEASCGVSPALFASQPKNPEGSTQCLSFYLNMFTEPVYASEMGTLKIFIWQDGVRREILIREGVQSVAPDHWQKVQVTLDVTPGHPFSIIFEATSGGLKSDMAIDDITIVDDVCDSPVTGNWGLWSEWTCDQSCGEGTETRNRACDSPAPFNGGAECEGENSEDRDCVDFEPCPVNGGWTGWSEWSDCTKTCETGERYSTRECTDPIPAHDGDQCEDLDNVLVTETCNSNDCTINGLWGEWSDYDSGCEDISCGDGRFASKSRLCDSPEPFGDGTACLSDGEYLMTETETLTCEEVSCPINGGFSDWTEWSDCSETCSSGMSFKYRSCNDPEPEGGEDCDGNDVDSQTCFLEVCPVNGNWGEWVVSSGDLPCTEECYEYTQMPRVISKHRSCDDPEPEGTGEQCEFHDFSDFGSYESIEETCTTVICAVDGDWSDWEGLPCDATCGATNAYQSYTRACNDPPPMHDGMPCEGNDEIYIPCNQEACPGSWNDWVDDTTSCLDATAYETSISTPPSSSLMDVSCGSGVTEAVRTCDMTVGTNTGMCLDDDGNPVTETHQYQSGETCEVMIPCPVDGAWGDWLPGSCDAACGWGTLQEVRTCDDPAPADGGAECSRTTGPDTDPMDREETSLSDPAVPCYFQHCSSDDVAMSCDFEDFMTTCGAVSVTSGSRWNVRNTATTTPGTGPGPAAVTIAGYYIAFESSSVDDLGVAYVGDDASFTITYTSMTLNPDEPRACLQFYYHFYSADDVADVGEFTVTLVDGSAVETEIFNLNDPSDDDDDEWKRFSYDFDDTMNTNLAEVRFYARSASSKSDKAIDRIGFYPVECDKIQDYPTAAPTP